MANTININIKNCCCGSGSTGSSSGEIVPITELPDPTGIDGPPEGFGPPSSITDRQCKTAVFLYEWLYWWLDKAVNSSIGAPLVNLLISDMPFVAKAALTYVLVPIITGALGSLVTWGIDIADVVIGPLSSVLGLILAHSIVNAMGSYTFTLPVIEDILTKLPTYRDQIICYMSQAENQSEVYGQLEDAFKDAGFTDGQIALIFAVMPPAVIGLLYWSADWWPSFETESLASITETCCGSLTPGLPLPAGTDKCTAANFVLDQLIELFNNTHEFITGFSIWHFIFLDMENEIFEHIQSDLVIPRKLKETAFNVTQFQRYLAKYMVARFYSFAGNDLSEDGTFDGLAQYFADNDEAIVCALYEASTPDVAYSAPETYIDTYLAANEVLDTDCKSYVKTAIDGIIHAHGQFLGLLFTQDIDLLGYTGVVDCATCSGSSPACAFETYLSPQTGVYMGTITSQSGDDPVTLVVQAVFTHAGVNTDHWWIFVILPEECQNSYQITNIQTNGWTDHGEWNDYAISGYQNPGGNWHPYQTVAELIGAVIHPGGGFQVLSGTDFTATFTLDPVV